MAWFRMMGADSVAYHRETVLERADDHPGTALAYYASRGETPLVWGGSGAASLGLTGTVTDDQYTAVYGPGGACDPSTGERLVATKTPGMELVIAAHKSVAMLGVIGRAEDMHAIMDAERDATLGYLDDVALRCGGRRGKAGRDGVTATSGLVYGVTRHGTSRAGDPGPHDHVLIANLVEMRDTKGGYKGLHTAVLRDHLHAATMMGRAAAAAKAVELGYGIEADTGPSGKLRHWGIAGVPRAVVDLFSKRNEEINETCEARGVDSYDARRVVARDTRDRKRHEPIADLMAHWRGELAAAGVPVEELEALIDDASQRRELRPDRLTRDQLSALAGDVLGADGVLSQRKVFARRDVIVAVAERFYGMAVGELTRGVDRVLADPDAIARFGVPRASERPYSTATVIATEQTVEAAVAAGVARTDAVRVPNQVAAAAVAAYEKQAGRALTDGQRQAVLGIATSGRGVDVALGLAGSGKTTMQKVVAEIFAAAGCQVIGTATSGQAARTLGREAGIDTARTVASLRWRLEHGKLTLDHRSVVIHDEAGMTDDTDVAAVLEAARVAGAKVVTVGDDRQLGAIAPGGSLGAVVERHGGTVYRLEQNVRQADTGERQALADLRAGHLPRAVRWYRDHDRIVTAPSRLEALGECVAGWAADALAGTDAAMFAYRIRNVAALNALARQLWDDAGRLSGPEVVAPGGAGYRAGDRVVTLASGARGQIVTSERGVVAAVDVAAGGLRIRMEDGRLEDLAGEDIGAERLAHGYAITVHRSQGATVDVTHAFEDGGGRELTYVRMSRARDTTMLYVAAGGDMDAAEEDLCREWAVEKRWHWAIDTTSDDPAADLERHEPGRMSSAVRRAQLVERRGAVAAAIPADRAGELAAARRDLADTRAARSEVTFGTGRYRATPIGVAARKLASARKLLEGYKAIAALPGASPVVAAERVQGLADCRRAETAALEAFHFWGGQVERVLEETIDGLRHHVDDLAAHQEGREEWLARHPDAERHLQVLDNEIEHLDNQLAATRSRLDDQADTMALPQAVGAENLPPPTVATATATATGTATPATTAAAAAPSTAAGRPAVHIPEGWGWATTPDTGPAITAAADQTIEAPGAGTEVDDIEEPAAGVDEPAAGVDEPEPFRWTRRGPRRDRDHDLGL